MSAGFLAAAVLSLALSACAAEPTPYQPKLDGTGYSQQQLDSRTWRVQFAGNYQTSRETVENYLLYRAAEVMRFGGYDEFLVLEKEIERDVVYWGDGPPRFFFGHSVFSGHRHRHGFHHGAYFGPSYYRPNSRYTGYAVVRSYEGGPVPAGATLYNAPELIQQLGPTIRLPTKQAASG